MTDILCNLCKQHCQLDTFCAVASLSEKSNDIDIYKCILRDTKKSLLRVMHRYQKLSTVCRCKVLTIYNPETKQTGEIWFTYGKRPRLFIGNYNHRMAKILNVIPNLPESITQVLMNQRDTIEYYHPTNGSVCKPCDGHVVDENSVISACCFHLPYYPSVPFVQPEPDRRRFNFCNNYGYLNRDRPDICDECFGNYFPNRYCFNSKCGNFSGYNYDGNY